MTLEEAQNKILELTDELTQAYATHDELSKNNDTLKSECEKLRELNQKYFNRLIAQEATEEEQEEEEQIPTCEEFAAGLDM